MQTWISGFNCLQLLIQMGTQDQSRHRESAQQMSMPNPNPNPNHEDIMRNSPLLLRVHADDQDKKTTCLFWTLLFAIAFITGIIANFAIPAIYVKNSLARSLSETSISSCQNPAGLSGTQITCSTSQSQFAEIVTRWKAVNQFSLIYLEVRPNDLKQSIKLTMNYMIQVTPVELKTDSTGVKNYFLKGSPSQLNATMDFSSSSADELYDGQTFVGYQYLLAVVTQLDGQPFQNLIKFQQNLNTTTGVYRLQSYAINSRFTNFTIILRYVFFGLAIVGCVLYFIRYIKIPESEKIIEQKMIAFASGLLIMFNDPFYPITVLKPNPASGFFSMFFVVNLISFLVFMWIVIADRIYFEDGQKETAQITKKKIAYSLLFWVILIICLTVYTMQQVDGTPLVADNFNRKFRAARVIIGIVLFFGIFYIGFRFIRSCMAPQGRTWRSYLFMAFSSVFIFAVFIIVISNSLILFNYSGSVILLVYALINVYIYYLQYMFTITREEVDKLVNPASVIPDNNYDMITVGTIDIVDVNLDDDVASNKMDVSYNAERKELQEEKEEDKEKSEFQPYGFD